MTNTQPGWEQFALLLIDVQRDFWSEQAAKTYPAEWLEALKVTVHGLEELNRQGQRACFFYHEIHEPHEKRQDFVRVFRVFRG